ncbi:hypothetical protein [Proteiniborus sp. MB09-C3]|uniref:hypothetical protein n=1 Tax=Proteiniborus sp. MB09-C3 TaxID=3050072 RepID=UPI00255722B5|nr:hypothetical protein [Proteiniborus sp. MB09-C3]WIV13220.1 hypothetical protein QO263_05790 [Proteiniborus sp. MB09-C3]
MNDMTEMIGMRYEELYKLVSEDRTIWECLNNTLLSDYLLTEFIMSLRVDNVLNIIRYEEAYETKYADATTGKITELTDIELMLSDFKEPDSSFREMIVNLIKIKIDYKKIDKINNTPIKELRMQYNW